MGADNLAQLPKWDRWLTIMNTMPVAVLDRPGYARQALGSLAAQRFAQRRLPEERACELALVEAPAWIFLTHRLHPASATALRARGGWAANEP
jgi:nicotinate-nucleotide adenylyltransferase